MKKTFWQALAILLLGVCAFVLSVRVGGAEFVEGNRLPRQVNPIGQKIAQVISNPLQATPAQAQTNDPHGVLNAACAVRPGKPRRPTRKELGPVRVQLGLDRFRRMDASFKDPNVPKEIIALAHPTNFGWRYKFDANGRPANQAPIVVLHETVSSAQSTINFFQTPHPNDADQVSYHVLIDLDGAVIYMVPPDKRAFGAGNSQFNGISVKTNATLSSSVNNFAYHISLVTPRDGRNNKSRHSGYTNAQYDSLAWVLSKTGIPATHITAHKLVDRSGSRSDPRSFDGPKLLNLLKKYPRSADIALSCR
ncbi:N-acetylmuramoyl-L-alanine amidase [filamentous cyanobacterium LEGE 11480]|uniref:N-acetylmuramoyl-L-alanine amidase n=1 Tax=Romeriopsis navalis LEGE 11480 TaxID=2777977 RepID=A0A928VRA1_9CYAN|nr:peptidoglycan recognition family protein [Romeriopsis navalis]MBE9033283.1 N-acetylmuramoyl-L-alanine amidase [Romeriopsis navalis LEGE 11480]